jgi:hypothetical protein
VYRVEKSKDCNRSGEALSISDLERFRLFITSTTPVESLRIQLLSQGTSAFLSLDTQRSLTVGNIALKKEHKPLRNISQRTRAGYTDKSRFNWNFMKLPNCTKKRETRATLNTFKIMSLIKREMRT